MSHTSFRFFLYSAQACLLVIGLSSCAPAKSAGAASPSPVTAPHPATAPPKVAKAPGGASQTTSAAGNPYHFEQPKLVRGIYLTAWSASSPKKMEKMMKLLDDTELNSVVIDVRDTGEMYFDTGIPLVKEIEGKDFLAIPKPEILMNRLKKHNVWPIARIACFRDNFLPKKHPERAVQVSGGKPWHDRSGHMWLDPYDKRNWDYLAQTVEFAINAGFPEIQLDYVRFPSEGKSKTQIFPNKDKYGDPKAKPWDVVGAFADYIREKVKARGCVYSADIFGIISSSKRDQGIGQDLETIGKPFDVLSPMIYPSHFAKGEYGIKDPNRAPYEIIHKSLADYRKRLPKKTIRPWLQDFSLGYHYGAAEVRAQMKAAHDLGYDEYLLWNAGNHYTESALKHERPMAQKPSTVHPPHA